MTFLTGKITSLAGIVLDPLPAAAGLILCSVVTALFILLVYKLVSNQKAIARHKNRIFGHFLEIYLFRDSPLMILASLVRVLGSIACYLGFFLPPLVIVFIPVTLLLGQLDLRYGHLPLNPGETTILKLEVVPDSDLLVLNPSLTATGALETASPSLRIEELDEINWKVRFTAQGDSSLNFKIGDSEFAWRQDFSPGNQPLYTTASQGSFLEAVEYPGYQVIPSDSLIKKISIELPIRELDCLFFDLHWVIIYFVLTIGLAFGLKKPFGVEF